MRERFSRITITTKRNTTMSSKMSKKSHELCTRLYDEYGINYHDIEISALNHLDFVQMGRVWSDIIGGNRVSFVTMGVGEDMVMWCDDGTEALPHDLWEPDFVDIDLYLKLKADLVRFVIGEIEHNRYGLTKVSGNKALISKGFLWTAVRQVLGRKNEEKWVELYDNSGHGYILPQNVFKEAFKNK